MQTRVAEARRRAVVAERQQHPEHGTRRIRDVLARFEALGVSETEVRRILHEEGLLTEPPTPSGAREHPPRRFERAAPNQLWQSDIFTFLLRRHERLYLAAFMDDHSRFIVGHALAHHQRAMLVLEALGRGIRRQAAAIKRGTLTAMENDRRGELTRIVVTAPGVVRGFDAMHVATTDRPRYLLAAADAAVPYRTSVTVAERYDSSAVVHALGQDLALHGAPLVLRLDRAKVHQTDEVAALLEAHGVLVLHGPPRLPRYYGQLERQNREHRAWLDALGPVRLQVLEAACGRMLLALNGLWRRPTLGWRTAEEVWSERAPVDIDRVSLREEVRDEAERLEHELADRGDARDLAQRLAIEHALTRRGLLRLEPRGWC